MKFEEVDSQYDVICIGSGMGSLTVASLLAQFENKKILVIERHFQAGGFTHAFSRKNRFHWDVGIHYIGDMQTGGFSRTLMDTITHKGVDWQRMAEPFEKFVYPNRTFELFGDPQRFQTDLIAAFPKEETAITQYFADIKKAAALFGKSMMMKSSAPDLSAFQSQLGNSNIVSLKDYLDVNFVDPDLKAILASQWGDYGLPPSKCLFATHAALVVHYLNGGYYPIGGGGNIFKSIKPLIEEKSGQILDTTEVKEILIQNKQTIGVRAQFLRGKQPIREFYAPIVVSGIGAWNTYNSLVPESEPIQFREALRSFYKREKMATSICVYLGLSESPAKFGFAGENHWIFASNDHEKNFASRNDWIFSESPIGNLYLSFPSLKDPLAEHHTADVITFCDASLFDPWKEQIWKKRGEDYEALKERIARKAIQTLETRFPGFEKIIEYVEVSTALTNQHFTGHPDGAIYGLACVPERYDKAKSPWFEVETPIKGLYLTGVDAGGSPGIAGAMMGGLASTLKILGNKNLLKRILKE
ncbi:NAD(P)-binding Rossmann-like domain protein [Leptospira ryugenii]|uniref:NAD(P)-binding Rossmann-like domain protein n=1 Tax=Leptospira ryugenii TaxID=1917863 RepID=A0A2P2DZM4_9LEPT|nr:NAD(P)/FAD-dependent oxidoreductase [Leptospira ryugenii]GBF50091.1 NAD(P)-binding Rossmann-like domain protein [Leptospira ryugenii]